MCMICTTNKILRISMSLDLYKTKCIIIVHAKKIPKYHKNFQKYPIGLILKSTICHLLKKSNNMGERWGFPIFWGFLIIIIIIIMTNVVIDIK